MDTNRLDDLRTQVLAARALPLPAERRAIRVAAGVGTQELAKAVGVSRQCIYQWERGDREPKTRRLRVYIEALRIMRDGS